MLIKFKNKWFGPTDHFTVVRNPDGTTKLGRSGKLYDKGVVELPEELYELLPRDKFGKPKYGSWERLDKEPDVQVEPDFDLPVPVETVAAQEMQRVFDAQHEPPKLTPAQERMARARAAKENK